MLGLYTPRGERALGVDEDEEFTGWMAQVRVAEALREPRRVVRVP